jgi:serine/threonine protein kinase
MGQVWSAVHIVTGRRVAIKRLLLSAYDDEDDHDGNQARARFILEAQAACAVEHPNVVEVLDFLEPDDEPPLLVMELLHGETLADKLEREHAIDIVSAANLLLPVVSAVGTAHSLGIIHRDLKPANIFLSERGAQNSVVKVLDFGIAKWVAERPIGSGLRTQTGSTLGTPCYMAPEQATGERFITHAADVWSLGIILYECLAGARPVEGENPAQMVMRLLKTGIMPIERVVPALPAEVSQLIGRMLSRHPARRPKDLREVFAMLQAHTATYAPTFGAPVLELVPAPESSTRASAPLPEVTWVPKTQPDSAAAWPSSARVLASGVASQPRSRRMRWALGSVTAGVVIIAAIAASQLRRPNPTSPLLSSDQPQPAAAAPAPVSSTMAASPSLLREIPVPPVATAATATAGDAFPLPSNLIVRVPKKAAGKQAPAAPSRSVTGSSPKLGSAASAPGAPSGASCERSGDCASRLCVAFACE